MKLEDLRRFRDPQRLWQRLVLYSKRARPRLRWQEADGFDALWRTASARSLSDEARAQTLFQLARHAAGLEGAFAEIGVYRGGTAWLLRSVTEPAAKDLHLFDTFAGMPETDLARDLHTAGDFADTSLASVRTFVGEGPRVHYHAGRFPDTAGPDLGDRFAFVHVDVDIAQSVTDACELFYPRMVPGGVLVFDDYGFTSCPGAKRSVDAFFAGREPVLHLATSQAIVLKRG